MRGLQWYVVIWLWGTHAYGFIWTLRRYGGNADHYGGINNHRFQEYRVMFDVSRRVTVMLGDMLSIMFWSFCDDVMIILGWCYGHFGIMLWSFWDDVLFILRWCQILGRRSGHFGIMLWSFWDDVLVILDDDDLLGRRSDLLVRSAKSQWQLVSAIEARFISRFPPIY